MTLRWTALVIILSAALCACSGSSQRGDVSDPSEVRLFGESPGIFAPGLYNAVLAPDHGLVITSSPDGVCYHSIYSREPLGCPITEGAGSIALSHDQSVLAVGLRGALGLWSIDRAAWLWRAEVILGDAHREPYFLSFSEDDRAVVVLRWGSFDPLTVIEVKTGATLPLTVGVIDSNLIPRDAHHDGAMVLGGFQHLFLFDPIGGHLSGLDLGRHFVDVVEGRGPYAEDLFICHSDGVGRLSARVLKTAPKLDAFAAIAHLAPLDPVANIESCLRIASAPDGDLIVHRRDGALIRVDPGSGLIQTRARSAQTGLHLVHHPTEPWLLSETRSSVRFIDAETLEPLDPPPQHTSWITSGEVSDAWLIAGSLEGVGVWEREAETLAYWLEWEELEADEGDAEEGGDAAPLAARWVPTAIATSPNASWLAIGWSRQAEPLEARVRLYRLEDGAPTSVELHYKERVLAATFLGEESLIVALEEGDLDVVHLHSGQSWMRIDAHPEVEMMAVSGETLFTCSRRGAVRLWSTRTGEQTMLPLSLPDSTCSVSADSARAAVLQNIGGNQLIAVFSLLDSERLVSFGSIPEEPFKEAMISPDGRFVAARTREKVYVWDVDAEASLGALELPEANLVMRFSPDGERLYFASQSGAIWVARWPYGETEAGERP